MTVDLELWPLPSDRLRGVLRDGNAKIADLAGYFAKLEELDNGHASVELHLWVAGHDSTPGVRLKVTLPPPFAELVRRVNHNAPTPPTTTSIRVPLAHLSITGEQLMNLLGRLRDGISATVRFLTGPAEIRDDDR